MPDIGIRTHQAWLGLIQPVGLVVAPAALVSAQIVLDVSDRARWLTYDSLLIQNDGEVALPDWITFASAFLGWEPDQLAGASGGPALPASLTISLPELHEQLEPTFAVPDPHQPGEWLLLIRVENGASLDDADKREASDWNVTPHERFERLLRETGTSIGVIVNDSVIRLVYAPRGESSGYLSFPVQGMAKPDGRLMLQALYELLKGWRLSSACPPELGLRHVLVESRRYQNTVSTRLAEQVLHGLYELTRGMQAADDAVGGAILQETLRQAPSEIYGGLLSIIMRLVFVLYAEERKMLPPDSTWVNHYGVGALFEQLRADRARYPDTMDQRYGAWAQLLSLFRVLHDGAHHGTIVIPPRAGDLFDPDRYPFLEGRPWGTHRVMRERLRQVPRVSDGAILRVLDWLLILDEERLSYRALDVEQIGSVYEAMMGFEIRAAVGPSIAVRPKTRKRGSPSHAVVNLEELLAVTGRDRAKWLKKHAECEVTGRDADRLTEAKDLEALLEALAKRRSSFTPQVVRRGAIVLVPTEERRRSGSHYTPRELTEPIVDATLRPVVAALGSSPTPEQLLSLTVCDPAMGSGAFLVGACRWLGEQVVDAWRRSGTLPSIPPDEEPQLYARRLVAQRCLYGVDRNPYAVQLAKLSLWLVTLAREHPFTFLDHALRWGDSLVGLSHAQLKAFHWDPSKPPTLFSPTVEERVTLAMAQRQAIEELAGSDDTREKVRLLRDADDELHVARLVGDAVVSAFFGATKAKPRELLRQAHEQDIAVWIGDAERIGPIQEIAEELRDRMPAVVPFHWDIEFPEVFGRPNPGFDAIVGNPPFAGKNTLIDSNPTYYMDWLKTIHHGAHGNADLVAHFFRRAFTLLRQGGTFGLIATNTIAQGDTRATGLHWLRKHGCTLYNARRRYRWPGAAAVIVSVVHGRRGPQTGPYVLDGRVVPTITAFLFYDGGDDDPKALVDNANLSFIGTYLLGMGFTFDDDKPDATPLAEMQRLIAEDPTNSEVIFPYLGGEEVNDNPTHEHRRYVINFGDMSEAEARAGWPDLMRIVETKVRPVRETDNRPSYRRHWWQFAEKRNELRAALATLERVLVINCGATPHMGWTVLSLPKVLSHTLTVVTVDRRAMFATLQSRPHEIWARFFASSMKDDLRYTPTDCFETFPFPVGWQDSEELECVGRAYYDFRAELMIRNGEGLTTTYNRFHNPNERDPGILRLRELHDELDRAVLSLYEWSDLRPTLDFFPEHEEDNDDDETASGRRQKAWRYRWPDSLRDEVLARLWRLNRVRSGGSVSSQ